MCTSFYFYQNIEAFNNKLPINGSQRDSIDEMLFIKRIWIYELIIHYQFFQDIISSLIFEIQIDRILHIYIFQILYYNIFYDYECVRLREKIQSSSMCPSIWTATAAPEE